VIVEGAVALVTGASSGIGAEIATRLRRAGADVIVHGRDERRLAALADRIGARPIAADLARPGDVERLAAEAVDGGVRILVANAGRGWAGPFGEMDAEDAARLIEVNLTAPIRLTRALLPHLDAGFLAYVTSIAGRTGVPGEAVYAATKAGLDAFAESLRHELRGTGVRVGVVVPGVVDTPFFVNRGKPYARRSPRPIPAATVAEATVDMILRDRAEVYRPRWLRVPVAIRGLAPRAYRGLAGRFGGS
jgi:short-subunit dehydrogenase